MASQYTGLGDNSDAFRLHYVRKAQRCVVDYDTLDAALAGAFNRLQKDQWIELWITDAGKQVLLDAPKIRERFAQRASAD